MESHPIPQQISSYQFRLVGDMTLKQFFQLGGGALVGFLIYSTGLHPFIKWPLVLTSVSLGAALAFLPFEERPLSRWVIVFFRSVYSPTIYLWQKSKTGYRFFQEEETTFQQFQQIDQTQVEPKENLVQKTPIENEAALERLEKTEENLLSRIIDAFKTGIATQTIKQEATSSTPATIKKQESASPHTLTIPTTQPKSFRPKIVIEEKVPRTSPSTQTPVSLHQVVPISKETTKTSERVQFSTEAAPPFPSTIPNTITGQVVDENKKIIEGAILEVRDLAGRPVRALRSNKLGHFMIATALPDGQYDIITEKEGYEFKPVTFKAEGKIIPPILIQAESQSQTPTN